MRIKVTDGNYERLKTALDSANGKAWKHTADPEHVQNLAVRAERSLMTAGLPQRSRIGAEAIWHGAGPAAKAYGYKMTRTCITLTRGVHDWFMTDVKRIDVYPQQSERYRIKISTAQRDRIVTAALRTFDVRNAAEAHAAPAS